MSISIQCPDCKKNLKVKDELGGKRVKCPACGTIMRLPRVPSLGSVASIPGENIDEPRSRRDDDDYDDEKPTGTWAFLGVFGDDFTSGDPPLAVSLGECFQCGEHTLGQVHSFWVGQPLGEGHREGDYLVTPYHFHRDCLFICPPCARAGLVKYRNAALMQMVGFGFGAPAIAIGAWCIGIFGLAWIFSSSLGSPFSCCASARRWYWTLIARLDAIWRNAHPCFKH